MPCNNINQYLLYNLLELKALYRVRRQRQAKFSRNCVCVAAMIFKINFSFLPFFLELRIKRQRKKENTDLAESSIKAGNVFVPISKQILRR